MRPAHVDTIRDLALEAALAEIVTAMNRCDVAPLLIKGPAIARWLYDDPRERRFGDLDLLVAPDRYETACSVLATAGFIEQPALLLHVAPLAYRPDRDVFRHDAAWTRSGAVPVTVDLHRTLFFLEDCDPLVVWQTLTAGGRTLELGGVSVTVPGVPAHALIVALHAAQHGRGSSKPLEDLRRAVVRLSEEDWRAAVTAARALDAEGPFAAGLRLLPAGAALAERLGLTDQIGERLRLCVNSAPRTWSTFGRIAAQRTLAERTRLVAEGLFPSARFLRVVEPVARRGPLGLALAYVIRPLRLLTRAPAGYVAWRRVARAERGNRRGRALALVDATRRAWWALRALHACRAQLPAGDIRDVRLPLPPPCSTDDERGVARVLRATRATCLERALIRQCWHQSRGDDRELVVGVTRPTMGFRAHAWLVGDRADTSAFVELFRHLPDRPRRGEKRADPSAGRRELGG